MSIVMVCVLLLWFGVFVVLNPLSYSSEHGEQDVLSEVKNNVRDVLYILFSEDFNGDRDSSLKDSAPITSYDGFLKKIKFQDYTIKSGDTIIEIARKNSLDIDTIISYNKITDHRRLQVGQRIILPSMKGVLHEVKRGENLWSIVRKYARFSVNMDDVVRVNDIHDETHLFPGESLFIPGAKLLDPMFNPDVFAKPVVGVPISPVGRRLHPVYHRYRFHSGLDIRSPHGSPVRVVKEGIVTFAGWKGGYGKLIIVSHGKGLESRYGHLSKILVKRGQRLKKKHFIGRVGSTGLSTGPHLHFEMRKNNRPQKILKKFKGLYGHIGQPW